MAKTARKHGYKITSLSRERAKKRKVEARDFTQQARKMGLDVNTLAKIDAAAQSSENWIFVMLSPNPERRSGPLDQSQLQRPHKMVELWATLLEHLRMDTGEIMASRAEISQAGQPSPENISSTMTELAEINAVRREKQGRNVRYFLNPGIVCPTHMCRVQPPAPKPVRTLGRSSS